MGMCKLTKVRISLIIEYYLDFYSNTSIQHTDLHYYELHVQWNLRIRDTEGTVKNCPAF